MVWTRGAAELLRGDHLVGHGLHHVRAGDEHVARVAHHEDEVGHRRRIDVAAGARPHDDADLGNDARGDDVALEHLAVAAQGGDALLDAGAAGVEQADDRRARLHGGVLHLDDLLRVGFRQATAEHGEILGEQEHGAAVDGAPAGHHAVAGDLLLLHAEVAGAVLDEHVELLERALVEQELDALARGQLAALVLRLDARRAAAGAGLGAALFQLVEDVLHAGPFRGFKGRRNPTAPPPPPSPSRGGRRTPRSSSPPEGGGSGGGRVPRQAGCGVKRP